MNIIEILLLVIAVGVCSIWYELRYGIKKRKEWEVAREELIKDAEKKSDKIWEEFSEARQNSKKWLAYLKKEGIDITTTE